MNNKINLAIVLLLLSCQLLSAQDDVAALRFSYNPNTGTARGIGMAGSFGAAGADFSTISTNPAGLAFFRSSQISVTGNGFVNATKSTFNNEFFSTAQGSVGLNNFGAVLTKLRDPKTDKRPTSKWKSYFFSIGFNKLSYLGRDINFRGETQGTILDYYVASANGKTLAQLDPFNEGLAYDTGLIYETANANEYQADLNNTNRTFKEGTVSSKGKNNEMAIAFGANYNHKWYFGAAIGVPFITYEETYIYSEEDRLNQDTIFNSLSHTTAFTTNGIGLNAKAGVIYRFSKHFRLGASVTSPTRLGLTDGYTAIISSNLNLYPDENQEYTASPEEGGSFSYKLITPWKAMFSAAYFVGKSGFINVDLEYIDYKSMRYDFGDDSPSFITAQNQINENIQLKYKGAVNLKVGAEYAKDSYRFRAGVAYNGSPFHSSIEVTESPRLRFSGGLGYYWKNSSIDFGYSLAKSSDSFLPYSAPNSSAQVVKKENSDHQLSLTFGFKIGQKKS